MKDSSTRCYHRHGTAFMQPRGCFANSSAKTAALDSLVVIQILHVARCNVQLEVRAIIIVVVVERQLRARGSDARG
jgi:hypothetical protein